MARSASHSSSTVTEKAQPKLASGNGSFSASPGTKRIMASTPSAFASVAASLLRKALVSIAVIGLPPPSRFASNRSSEPAPQPTSRIASPGLGAMMSIRVRNIAW